MNSKSCSNYLFYFFDGSVRKYLNENIDKLLSLRESRKHQEKLNVQYKEKATAEDIARWIDSNFLFLIKMPEMVNKEFCSGWGK